MHHSLAEPLPSTGQGLGEPQLQGARLPPPCLDPPHAAKALQSRMMFPDRLSETVGILGRAVGAPFAVLVAEELFACGCRLLISITSAGQIVPVAPPPYFVVIDRALRDEGTSYHYAPPSEFAEADPSLLAAASAALKAAGLTFHLGASWTTDAPFRETEQAI